MTTTVDEVSGAFAPDVPEALAGHYLPSAAQTIEVVTPVGHLLAVLTQGEADFYNAQSRQYMDQFAFNNIADLSDLGRLLFMELQTHRLSGWLSTGRDYDGEEVDSASTRRAVREYSDQISKIKNDLGMTKSQRDKEREQSSAAYIRNLQVRAKEFGIHREHQLRVALQLMNDASAIVGSFDRSDAQEREKLGFRDEKEIVDWVRKVMIPTYQKVDQHFRTNQQKFWLQEI